MDRRRSLLKIAALRSERERQAGVDCTKGYLQSQDAGLLFDGPRTLECLFTYVPSDEIQAIAGFGISMIEIYALTTNQLRVYCGDGNATVDIVPGDSYLVDVAYDGTMAICYLNGAEAARFPVTGYKITDLFRTGSNTYIPQGSLVFCRHYNYAISAEEAAAHYNDGDPAGYVLPTIRKYGDPFNISGLTSYTYTGETDPVYYQELLLGRFIQTGAVVMIKGSVSDYQSGEPFVYVGNRQAMIPAQNGSFTLKVINNRDNINRIYYYGGTVRSDRRLTITIDSVESVGCVAEYLPQNIRIAQKRDFPQVVFPVAKYTPSSGVFDLNSLSATIIKNDQPQADGFSGAYTRFDAITSISLYCAYISDFIKKQAPLKITFEYRSNRILYSSNITVSLAASDAVAIDVNEGDAKIASVSCGVGAAAFVFSDSDPEAWLEMRVLSIEVAEGVAISWLDSAKQLPLNDEYLPPLLEPIVISDETPIRITGENSYTWTGVSDPNYSYIARVSRPFTIGQLYKIRLIVSNWEAGNNPFIKIGTTGSYYLPDFNGNGTYEIYATPNDTPYSGVYIYAGLLNTDRRMTITVDSIEPIVEHSYDLTANGMPQIIIK